MKKTTKLILGAFLITLSLNAGNNYVYPWQPQGELSTCGNSYITSNAGWSSSEYYRIIDIDASKLTDAALPKFTSADGSKNAADTDFGFGYFRSPIMTTTDGTVYTPTNVMWPVKYNMAAFAPTMYNSAYSKVNLYGSNPSGTGTTAACTNNNNTVKTSPIWDKPGFIELSRLAATTTDPTISRHGYIQINDLPQVERIQWSYSSTSWKRGVKCDIDLHDGNGWIPRRWLASDFSAWEASFSEQGYQFEEMINQQDNPNAKVSIRFRIWDGDSIHFKVNANDLTEQTVPYTAKMTPLAQWQTVRIHQIKVYSGLIPTSAPEIPNALHNVSVNDLIIYRSGNNIIIGENSNIEIYTLEGRKMYKGYTNKIDVSGFSKGTYILRSINDNGIIRNKKIMI